MIKTITYPFRSTALVVNLSFTVMISLLIFGLNYGGVIGAMMTLPGWIILLPWFMKYCFIVGKRSAYGDNNAPNLSYDDLSPFEMLPIVFTATLVTLAVTIYSLLGPTAAVVLIVTLTPAIISAFILEDSIIQAMNPLSWFTYMIRMGLAYLAMLVILLAASALLYLIPDGIGVLLTVLLVQSIFIGMFHAAGKLLYSKKDSIEFDIFTREEQLAQIDQHFEDKHFADKVSKWHRMSGIKHYDDALQEMLAYVSEKEDSVDSYAQIFSALIEWRDLKMSAMFMQHYNEKLIRMKQSGQALSNLLLIWDKFGPVMPKSDSTALQFAQLARERNREDVASAILKHFANAFPDSPMLGKVLQYLRELENKNVG
ncbi:MAG: hypothetical protein EP297_13930 [Gammaproteobacteria bacterium]|nr:MAG: hypothetical protein EP297_13930 [Gammaproteobacteria bacterium]